MAAAIALVLAALVVGNVPSRLSRSAPFFGVDVPNADQQEFTRFADRLGVQPSVEAIFIKLDSTAALRTLAHLPSSVVPFVTLEPWSQNDRWGHSQLEDYDLASIIDGSHDKAFLALAHHLAGLHRPMYLRFAHEMNGTWYPWAEAVNGNQPGQYRDAWRHVHDLMAPVLGRQVKWVWSPNILYSSKAPSYRELFPGSKYVDLLGLTGYGDGTHPSHTFCASIRALRKVSDRPIVLSETGVRGPDKAGWLARLGPFLAAEPDIVGFVYFNTSPATTGASGDYRIDEHPAALSALRGSLLTMGLAAREQSAGGC